MKIKWNPRISASPFSAQPTTVSLRGTRDTETSEDVCGAFSLEEFATAGDLAYTHEDADGWLDYLANFHTRNFWYKDSHVKIWAYQEQYDNWQDTYGIDAVLAVYHSGHGAMTSSGEFQVPLGADWGGLGTTATSSTMAIGNEQTRYVFWSTCTSCRVNGGHTPLRTWYDANRGFRMLFGFETVSVDDPDYGKYFWEEWGDGKSLSTAWLDASWRISHNQSPAVVACGATSTEARDRLYEERLMQWGSVSRTWWHWRWYETASSRGSMRARALELPHNLAVADLVQVKIDGEHVRGVGSLLGFDSMEDVGATVTGCGTLEDPRSHKRLSFRENGTWVAELAKPRFENEKQLNPDEARIKADEKVKYLAASIGVELVPDLIRLQMESSGTDEAIDRCSEPIVTETTIQYRQVINGAAVITPGRGTLSISLDNDGTITRIDSRVLPVARLRRLGRNLNRTPSDGGDACHLIDTTAEAIGALLDRKLAPRLAGRGRRIPYRSFSEVPESREIGYEMRGREAVVVVHREVEIDFGSGYLKRYRQVVPLFE